MKTILAVIATILLCAAHALAEQPELADEALVLRWQRDIARVELARRTLAELERVAETSKAAILTRHKIQPGDEIEPETRVIKRAPKPSVAPPKKEAKQ